MLAGALLTAGLTSCSTQADAVPASGAEGETWYRLPDPPLSPRVGAVLVGVDDPGRTGCRVPAPAHRRGALLNGHYSGSPGWLLDPGTWTWSELPVLPGDHEDINGVLDSDRAIYGIGLVYDSEAHAYVTVPPPPGRDGAYDQSGANLGRDLVVFGGQRWPDGPGGQGELLNDALLFTAPTG